MSEDNKKKFYQEIIQEILNAESLTKTQLNQLKITLAKKHNLKAIVKNANILAHTAEEDRAEMVALLNNKPVRELSGVTVVALFAKPHGCPHGKCMYCPGGPGSPFGDTPQSYTGQEPAALRAARNLYDPYLQIFNRLEHYVANGHDPDKLELIFMGGTFPSLDQEYRDEFVYYTYKAINDFGDQFFYEKDGKRFCDFKKFNEFFEMEGEFNSQERQDRIHMKILEIKTNNAKEITEENLKEELDKNETALIKSIGLTIETKPDWAMEKHCKDMLRYGCTRLEVGVQTLDDECLKKTNRGHNLDDTKKSFQVMKDMCFKINAHMMLGLPASTLEKDQESLVNLFHFKEYRPDMLKIYPCLVVNGTPLFNMYKLGKFDPISTQKAAEIIAKSYPEFPRYVRVMRVQRDIPTTVIEDGVSNSNLRQFVENKMNELGVESRDIRAREVGLRQMQGYELGNFDIKVEEFDSSEGKDLFIDVADEKDTMIGFIRLRYPKQSGLMPEITEKTALIRELHIYGTTVPVASAHGNVNQQNSVQHKGWGTKLVKKAEELAKEQGYEKMVIISGVGVRGFYRKLGYELEGPYMVKSLK
ncbi:MAG: tRNA uridine(34) 5-carboxymethylaminomethyl modification radical SAM/GNAT enzyme Elp3 [Nanoarchaeota archaeon]|nr:tRNA uridine(34) 5-carboxymethylaminomethyl modification radical SAM/GNAT enzyme Elp3 [Nanoarchaeota archaeon]